LPVDGDLCKRICANCYCTQKSYGVYCFHI